MSSSLHQQIQDDMKAAMRSKDKPRLGIIRLILSAIKQKEVDDRVEQDDAAVTAILGKMIKQRRDSVAQFEAAKRQDLADKEKYEITVVEEYLPPALGEDEINAIIDEVISATGANSAKDMGKVMGMLKSKIAGRADMGVVSAQVKNRLSS